MAQLFNGFSPLIEYNELNDQEDSQNILLDEDPFRYHNEEMDYLQLKEQDDSLDTMVDNLHGDNLRHRTISSNAKDDDDCWAVVCSDEEVLASLKVNKLTHEAKRTGESNSFDEEGLNHGRTDEWSQHLSTPNGTYTFSSNLNSEDSGTSCSLDSFAKQGPGTYDDNGFTCRLPFSPRQAARPGSSDRSIGLWDCSFCGLKDNFASRGLCRGCRAPNKATQGGSCSTSISVGQRAKGTPIMNEIYKGTVASIKDFGIFVEIGFSSQGLIHRTETIYEADKFQEYVRLGQTIWAKVIKMEERDKLRIGLTMKGIDQTTGKEMTADVPPANSLHRGQVVNVLEYGSFIKVPGYLCHGLLKANEEVPPLERGQVVTVRVIRILEKLGRRMYDLEYISDASCQGDETGDPEASKNGKRPLPANNYYPLSTAVEEPSRVGACCCSRCQGRLESAFRFCPYCGLHLAAANLEGDSSSKKMKLYSTPIGESKNSSSSSYGNHISLSHNPASPPETSLSVDDLEEIRLSREQLLQWAERDSKSFDKGVIGFVVKVKGINEQYKIGKVVGCSSSESFYRHELMGSVASNKLLKVRVNGETDKFYSLYMISSRPFEQDEFAELMSGHDLGISRAYLREKQQELRHLADLVN